MKVAICLTLALIWGCVRADVGFGDLPGTLTLEPGLGGLNFCAERLRIDAIGNEITKLVFDRNETVCMSGNLYFGQRKWTPLNSSRSNAMGISLWLINVYTECDGQKVGFVFHRPLETISMDTLGFRKNVTYEQRELYLSIYQPGFSSCIYKSDKPTLALAPVVPVEEQEETKQVGIEKESQTTAVWDWLGPLFALIITLVTVAFVTCKMGCRPEITRK